MVPRFDTVKTNTSGANVVSRNCMTAFMASASFQVSRCFGWAVADLAYKLPHPLGADDLDADPIGYTDTFGGKPGSPSALRGGADPSSD
jgi:hypothetical protein